MPADELRPFLAGRVPGDAETMNTRFHRADQAESPAGVFSPAAQAQPGAAADDTAWFHDDRTRTYAMVAPG
jgi:hypothetical protein